MHLHALREPNKAIPNSGHAQQSFATAEPEGQQRLVVISVGTGVVRSCELRGQDKGPVKSIRKAD